MGAGTMPPRRLIPAHAISMRQHNLTPLDLIMVETSRDLAMWTNDKRIASDHNLQVLIVSLIDGFLKCNKPCAGWISAPNGEVPLRRCTKIIVGACRSDDASPSVVCVLSGHKIT